MARRGGVCSCIYSDYTSNFVGTRSKISELQSIARAKKNNEEIVNFFVKIYIEWKIFSDFDEAGIKVVKFHFKRVIGEIIITLRNCWHF